MRDKKLTIKYKRINHSKFGTDSKLYQNKFGELKIAAVDNPKILEIDNSRENYCVDVTWNEIESFKSPYILFENLKLKAKGKFLNNLPDTDYSEGETNKKNNIGSISWVLGDKYDQKKLQIIVSINIDINHKIYDELCMLMHQTEDKSYDNEIILSIESDDTKKKSEINITSMIFKFSNNKTVQISKADNFSYKLEKNYEPATQKEKQKYNLGKKYLNPRENSVSFGDLISIRVYEDQAEILWDKGVFERSFRGITILPERRLSRNEMSSIAKDLDIDLPSILKKRVELKYGIKKSFKLIKDELDIPIDPLSLNSGYDLIIKTKDDDLKKDNDSSRFDSLQIMEVNDTEKKFINKHADELDDVENKYKFTFYYDILFHIAEQTSRILYDRVPDDYFVFGYIKGCVYAHLDNQEKIGLSDLTSEDYQDLMVNVLCHLYHFPKLEKKISTIDQDRYHSLDNPSDKKSLELIEYSEGVEAGYNDKQSQYEFENEILYGNEDFYISSGTQLASYLAKNEKKHQFKYAHSRKNIFYKIHEHSFYTALGEPTPNNYRHWVQYYEDESYFR